MKGAQMQIAVGDAIGAAIACGVAIVVVAVTLVGAWVLSKANNCPGA
jgi:uncharacterized membrane protein YfbV (UPF0208 family)